MHRIISLFIFVVLKINLLASTPHLDSTFPKNISSYNDSNLSNIWEILVHRVEVEPFNLVATLIFFGAIIHTFFSSYILKLAHKLEENHREKIRSGKKDRNEIHMGSRLLHFLGEVETVFGLWTIALGLAITSFYNWETFVDYVDNLHYTEPMFVVVVMTIASSRPVLKMFELILWKVVKLLGGTLEAWWLVILTLGPILGSFITEPAAMTISAYLLADKVFDINPSRKLKYTTLALLFINVSVGGTLTNFAAPPVLMVASTWGWSTPYMFIHFGIKALLGIIIINLTHYFFYKKELHKLKEAYTENRFRRYVQRRFISQNDLEKRLNDIEYSINQKLGFTEEFQGTCERIKDEIRSRAKENLSEEEMKRYNIDMALEQRFENIKKEEMKKSIPGLLPHNQRPPYRDPNWDNREDKVPTWVMIIHVVFMFWTVFNAHEPVLFIGGFLFFLGFVQVTAFYQNRINLKPALLVAFFLSGLIIHGGVQAWWIAPVLGNLSEIPLMLTSVLLTSFNDNAAITYLATLVENFPENLQYIIVAGAVSGGGLTIIANAPNPAGQSILKRYFSKGISSTSLIRAAIFPTLFFMLIFLIFGYLI